MLRHMLIFPQSVYSLLPSVAGCTTSSFCFPNFPNCSFPKETASIDANYLRAHFSISQSKALCSRVRDYLSELRWAACFEEFHYSLCISLTSTKFFAAATRVGLSG